MDYLHNNAFRVLGLPVEASDRQISSRYDELLTCQQIGQKQTYPDDFSCFGKLDRSEDSLQKAYQELQIPIGRVNHVLFWYWLHDPVDELAFQALRHGKKAGALAHWNQSVTDKKHTWSTVNNLSVLLLTMSLEGLKAKPELLPPQMKDCIDWWAMKATNEAAWDKIQELVPEYYPTHDYLIEQRHILRTIHSTFRGHMKHDSVMSQYLTLLEDSKFDPALKEEVRQEVISPYQKKITMAIASCEQKRTDDAAACYAHGTSLLYDTKEPLEQLRSILGVDEESVSELSNEIAIEVCACAIKYGNETDDFVNSRNLLVSASQFITDPAFKEKTVENIAVVTKNIRYNETFGTCWFCRKAPAIESAPFKVGLHKELGRSVDGVSYRTLEAKVPQCKSCRSKHYLNLCLLLAGIVLVSVIGRMIFDDKDAWILCAAVTAFIAYHARHFLPSALKATNFPPIQELLDEGWVIGRKP